jgi:hypothetical protein
MVGRMKLVSSSGCPFGGGPDREFQRAEVVAFGKQTVWGSAVVYYWVRLTGGTEVLVNASQQGKDDERWLRRFGKKLSVGYADRFSGWRMAWMDVVAS